MNRKSRYKIEIDFKKSKNSYIFDKSRNKYYLDFFGQYASLVIGYNNKIFDTKKFQSEIKNIVKQKIVNNEILSSETKEFNKTFQKFTNSNNYYKNYHYCCTGALAVESAIKAAIDYKKVKNPFIVSFKGSFHGINGYGGILSDRIGQVNNRLKGFPGNYWSKFDSPIFKYKNNKAVFDLTLLNKTTSNLDTYIKQNNNVSGIIIEPIQCTNGDRYYPNQFFENISQITKKYDVPLIFDEVQTGFCVTGKKWYFEHTNIKPDIVIFGKKTQTSGIMVNKKLSRIFKNPIRLEVTWDGDVVDMIRCKHIINLLIKENVLNNVNKMSIKFYNGLKEIKNIYNIRNSGLLFAIDVKDKSKQTIFTNKLFKMGMLCNPTGNNTIRFRPNLLVNTKEIEHALNIISSVSKSIK